MLSNLCQKKTKVKWEQQKTASDSNEEVISDGFHLNKTWGLSERTQPSRHRCERHEASCEDNLGHLTNARNTITPPLLWNLQFPRKVYWSVWFVTVKLQPQWHADQVFPLDTFSSSRHRSEKITPHRASCWEHNPGFGLGLRNQFPFQISLKEPVWRKELVLGSWLISSLLRLVGRKKFTASSPPSSEQEQEKEKKVGFSEAFPELDFHRAQATENREGDNKQRRWRKRETYFLFGRVMCVGWEKVFCGVTSTACEFTERRKYRHCDVSCEAWSNTGYEKLIIEDPGCLQNTKVDLNCGLRLMEWKNILYLKLIRKWIGRTTLHLQRYSNIAC